MLQEVLKNIKTLPENVDHWIVSYSGGVDSCVLADILHKNKPEGVKLSILHVNHGIQKESEYWFNQAKEKAKLMNAEFLSIDLKMNKDGTTLEEKARDLRYDFIAENVGKNSVVFMGHHKNDQAETVLFRIFRGTGIKGLKAIPIQREIGEGILFRPMLTVSRKDIVNYAVLNNITWVEDGSNTDTDMSRNFIRQELIPLISSRWPSLLNQLSLLASKAKDACDLNTEIAIEDFNKISFKYKNEHLGINYSLFENLSELRKKNVLSYIFEVKFGTTLESKNFENAITVLFSKQDNFSKVKQLKFKKFTVFYNGKNIWFIDN